ncbi:MAG: DUF308 domain-containing protein, partial [Pseudomonadota bacterium]|nr:DUF308 domain-containing protein [Pseudomonadota bacterium]
DMPSDNERLQAAAAGLKSRVSGKMGNVWWAFMLRGLLALGLGVSALIWPKLTLGLLVRLVGVYAMLDGAAGLISGIRGRDLQAYLLPALVSLAVGAVLLFWPGLTVKWLLIIFGIWALLHGANLFLAGRSADQNDPNRGLLLTIGLVLAVIGLVLIFWPGAGAVTISWLVAALAFVVGAMLVFLALRLRRVKLRVDKLGNVSR